MNETLEDAHRRHPLWDAVRQTKTTLASLDLAPIDSRVSSLDELLSIIEAYEDSPHVLITKDTLDTAHQRVVQLNSQLTSNIDSVFAQHSNIFAQTASVVRSWPQRGSTSLRGLGGEVQLLRQRFAEVSNDIERESNEFANELQSNAKSQTEALKSELAQVYSELNNRATAAEKRHEEKMQLMDGRVDNLVSQLAGASSDLDGLRNRIAAQDKRLDEAVAERSEAYAEEKSARTEDWKSLRSSIQEEADTHSREMNQRLRESTQILGAVGINATAGDYGKYAEQQEKAANLWRGWATCLFVAAAVVFTVFVFTPFLDHQIDAQWWEYALQRLGAPVGLAGVASFMARESGQHRRQQRIAKRAHLTLNSLEPFVATLPRQQRHEIRAETARKLFAGRNEYDIAAEDRREENSSTNGDAEAPV